MFIVNVPTANSNPGNSGLWGTYNGDTSIRSANNSAWGNGTQGNNGDFSGTSGSNVGSMSLNGGTLQTANVSFTGGQTQVLEAIGYSTLTATDALG